MTSQRPRPVLDDLLAKMPPNVTATFTAKQLEAMESALENRQWRRHPVDLRMSLPFFWTRFYFVLVAGEERRSEERIRQVQAAHPLWTPGNMFVLGGLIMMGVMALLSLTLLVSLDWRGILRPGNYPADIPFKEDQENCESSGRTWQNGECIDYEHNPTF
ncbi:MAG: hypothetical protein O3C67_06775 [Cyanobacteria bacterium]|nr:hypothetical protein [Cyanobacteriota bacterium]MEB3269889.1 hypothetical protein [Leptolyngbya sp.]